MEKSDRSAGRADRTRPRLRAIGSVAILICGSSGNGAFAQIPGLPGAVEPGRDRPGIVAPAQPNFDFRIETPGRSAVPRAVDDLRFMLNDIRVQGAVTVPVERFSAFYKDLIGKEVSLSDILDVAAAIEDEYRRNGYSLVRAFVPPQRVADGVFTINVVEGFLANIAVEGVTEATRERVRDFLQPSLESKPLRLPVIEQGLLLANGIPGTTASGTLRPSLDTPGASDLVVNVTRAPVRGGISIDNRGSKFSGLWTTTADVEVNSLLSDDDQLFASVAASSRDAPFGRIAGQFRYRRYAGRSGAYVSFIGIVTHGEPGASLRAFNVLTDSWAFGPRFTIPIKRTRAETVQIEAGFTVQDARIGILSVPFSHDRWRVADIGVSYSRDGFLGGAWAASAGIVKGLPILGADGNDSLELSRPGARTDFTKLTGAFRVTRPVAGPFSIALSAQGQYSFDPLIIGERFAFGGLQTGRGYDPAAITGDSALGGSFELRYDRPVSMSPLQALQPYVFFDAARVWDERFAPGGQAIHSTGAGIRFSLTGGIFGGIEVARTLTAVAGSDSGKHATKLLLNLAIRV